MKKLRHLFLITLCTLCVANVLISQEINPQLYSKTWLDNETRLIDGYNIQKIFGELPNNPSTYNYSPITAVAYKNLDSIKNDFKKVAEVEKWESKILEENLSKLDSSSPGGQIQVYLTRYNEERANFQWFFIVIRGVDDKGKLWEYNFPYKFPKNPTNNGWWNYTTVEVPIELPDSFYIYLNDRKSEFLSDFKFFIEKSKTN